MTSTSNVSAEPSSLPSAPQGLQSGWLKTGLIGAGALTVTWWALIACGIWRALEWAGV